MEWFHTFEKLTLTFLLGSRFCSLLQHLASNYYEASSQTHMQYILNVKYMTCIQRHHLIKNADND